jgi:hypothetical protein
MSFFGFKNIAESVTQTTLTVNNSDTSVVISNISRKWLILINTGAKDAWLSIGQAAVSGEGIFLGMNGGSFIFDSTINTSASMNAISDNPSTTFTVIEAE